MGEKDKQLANYNKMSKKELIKALSDKDQIIDDFKCKFEEQCGLTESSLQQNVRFQADLINLRKRHQKDRQNLMSSVREDILTELIHIKTNIDRAFSQIDSAKDMEGIKKGIKMVSMLMEMFLKNQGMEDISLKDIPFDPNMHDAVLTIEDDVKEDMVVEVIEKGYRMGDKVIIPMKAKVAVPKE